MTTIATWRRPRPRCGPGTPSASPSSAVLPANGGYGACPKTKLAKVGSRETSPSSFWLAQKEVLSRMGQVAQACSSQAKHGHANGQPQVASWQKWGQEKLALPASDLPRKRQSGDAPHAQPSHGDVAKAQRVGTTCVLRARASHFGLKATLTHTTIFSSTSIHI